jgi:glycine/D-amino acid oxidase-like deaminating enzyme
MARSPDTVVVVGLGVIGLSTALALARRGARVVGVDRFGSGDPRREALDRWARLEAAAERPILHLTGQVDLAALGELVADTSDGNPRPRRRYSRWTARASPAPPPHHRSRSTARRGQTPNGGRCTSVALPFGV